MSELITTDGPGRSLVDLFFARVDFKTNHIVVEADAMDRRFALFSIVVLLAAGCRQNPYVSSHLEILGAERRALEDRVLDLEFELERAEKRLDTYQDDRGGTEAASRSGGGRSNSRTSDDGEDFTTPSIVIPGMEDGLPPTLEPPRVNEGRPTTNELPSPPSGESADDSPRYRKPTRSVAVTTRGPNDPRITHIVLNPTLTGGTDFDRKSGDDGLIVVLEPRNAENEFVPLAGPVTAVVLDYAKRDQGAAALVARWNIDAKNVHKALVNDEYAQGIQLRLPWPDKMPEHSKLRLDVRYTTVDGRHLDARADVFVTLPGQFSARWTPRAPRAENAPDALPHSESGPVNVAQQPDANESAQRFRSTEVVQSAFTSRSPAAQVGPEEPDEEEDSEVVRLPPERTLPEQKARPSWQPNR